MTYHFTCCSDVRILHGKNDFAKKSKILAGYRKVIFLNYQNNYIERSYIDFEVFKNLDRYRSENIFFLIIQIIV